MYDQVYGIDHSANDMSIHIGQKPYIPTQPLRYCAAYSIYPEREGILKEIKGLEILTSHPLLVYSKVIGRPGDVCRHAKHGGHALAGCAIASDNREEYEAAVRLIESSVRAIVD